MELTDEDIQKMNELNDYYCNAFVYRMEFKDGKDELEEKA